MMKIFLGGLQSEIFWGIFKHCVEGRGWIFFSTVYNNPSLYRYIKVGPF